ncbi:hypothetical protein JTE90_015075 [Oedothorax gibbosus]|uniref:Uncharacterized protein n=1 Tax=Oedothorax gibbosus TaxID=931172 RepID=A0AAV6VSV9_9ARAC|nr:hypothetical protein JTE90_015075 [Oedothorax gibbosus]
MHRIKRSISGPIFPRQRFSSKTPKTQVRIILIRDRRKKGKKHHDRNPAKQEKEAFPDQPAHSRQKCSRPFRNSQKIQMGGESRGDGFQIGIGGGVHSEKAQSIKGRLH